MIFEKIWKFRTFIDKNRDGWETRRIIVRISITLVICFMAFAIPRFAVFLNMIGAVAGTAL
jgi:hypothetical protein